MSVASIAVDFISWSLSLWTSFVNQVGASTGINGSMLSSALSTLFQLVYNFFLCLLALLVYPVVVGLSSVYLDIGNVYTIFATLIDIILNIPNIIIAIANMYLSGFPPLDLFLLYLMVCLNVLFAVYTWICHMFKWVPIWGFG